MKPRNQQTLPIAKLLSALVIGVAVSSLTQSVNAADKVAVSNNKNVTALTAQLAKLRAMEFQEKNNLENFDDLDFNVFSNQKWPKLSKSHHHDIIVHNADGKIIRGLDAHIDDLKQIFVFAPDTRVISHPIRIAKDNWTAVQGEFTGTFSKPMPVDEGKTIAPTNKAFKLYMVTIGRWEDGVMKEEWLYWDNQEFMRQLGLGQ